PPEVTERAKQTHDAFVQFKNWLAQREQAEAQQDAAGSSSAAGGAGPGRVPTFREWLGSGSPAGEGAVPAGPSPPRDMPTARSVPSPPARTPRPLAGPGRTSPGLCLVPRYRAAARPG